MHLACLGLQRPRHTYTPLVREWDATPCPTQPARLRLHQDARPPWLRRAHAENGTPEKITRRRRPRVAVATGRKAAPPARVPGDIRVLLPARGRAVLHHPTVVLADVVEHHLRLPGLGERLVVEKGHKWASDPDKIRWRVRQV